MRGFIAFCLLCWSLLGWSSPGFAQSASTALLHTDRYLYSANMETGSLSKIDKRDGTLLAERALGQDLRRLALSADGVLAVTDYRGDRLYLLSAEDLESLHEIDTPSRPFGVIYDRAHRRFIVSLFETNQLMAVDTDGKTLFTLDTADTPRGLAITDDGRLLVSHAMIGAVSIYHLQSDGLTLSKRIDLAVAQHSEETDSQGLPRLLDDITISPDGSEAWLPHVLWNFDHAFQFQSTVFPAVSILDLTPGAEKEKVSERKELFRQIDIQNNANRTQIISNPFDAEFSPDGHKLFVTLAGSEDLLVFDRGRSGKASSTRHRRRKHRGGAKATQLVRHLPGQNPRGLVADTDYLYVQNAMSLDLTRLDPGQGPFARVRIDEPAFAPLVSADPLPDNLRRGLRLFHLGNTAANSAYPMTGNNWMSCNSCHLDGFNFTNRYLMAAHGETKADNAITGHANLKNMVAGDFIAEYMRLIQNTQGGLGHDDRDGAAKVDPTAAPAEVQGMMADLHQVVTAPHNLPYLATWIRLDDDRPVAHPEDWLNSASCRGCHQEMFEQWADSNHRLMGPSNPYYKLLQQLARETEGEEFGQWCQGCHMPQHVLSGNKQMPQQSHMLEQGASSLIAAYERGETVLEEGTGCFLCHRITEIEDAGGNAAFTVNLDQREQYLFEDADNPVLRWFAEREINAKPAAHKDSYLDPIYRDARYCKSCHDEFAPGTGANIVNTWKEWADSSFATAEDPSERRGCIDCHMSAEPGKLGEPIPGRSTENGPLKDNVFTHQFSGSQHFLAGLRNKEHEQLTLDLLRAAATLETRLEDGQLVVRVNNVGAGHALPTGVADFRQFWLQVEARDANGKQVLNSGIPQNGVVPDNARQFLKVFGDAKGNPVGLKFWRYARLLKDTRIPADGYRDEAFTLPDGIAWPLRVEVRLQYRVYPKWVNDAVRQENPELPEPPIVTLNRLTETLAETQH